MLPVRLPRSTRNLRPLLYLERNHRCETIASLGIRPPPIYPAQSSLKPRKKWVQTGGWILVVVLLLFGISTRSRNPLLAFVSLAFSVLYLLTLMTKKDAALTSRGLEIFYDMQFTTNYEFFPWEDINAIVCEDRGHADMVRLHIGHGNTEKALFFPREDLDEIYAFIKRRIRRSASWIMPRPNRSPARSTRSEQL